MENKIHIDPESKEALGNILKEMTDFMVWDDNQYFTPSIEDIRVGYECEWKMPKQEFDTYGDKSCYGWQKHTVTINDFDQHDLSDPFHNFAWGGCEFRTPYLTREQIEAEGWKFKHTNKTRWWYEKDDTFFECPMTTGYQIMRLEMVHDPEFKAIRIQAYYRGEAGYDKSEGVDLPIIFEGYCKDINTFRQICKLINI